MDEDPPPTATAPIPNHHNMSPTLDHNNQHTTVACPTILRFVISPHQVLDCTVYHEQTSFHEILVCMFNRSAHGG